MNKQELIDNFINERKKPDLPHDGFVEFSGVRGKWREPDNSWHERGELPPEETICESYDFDRSQWVKVKTLNARTGSGEIACVTIDESEAYGRLFFGCKFHPIKSEREKFVDAAANAFHSSCMHDYSGQPFLDGLAGLYDAGFKAPDEKSSS